MNKRRLSQASLLSQTSNLLFPGTSNQAILIGSVRPVCSDFQFAFSRAGKKQNGSDFQLVFSQAWKKQKAQTSNLLFPGPGKSKIVSDFQFAFSQPGKKQSEV